MSLRHQELNQDELAHQAGLERSWQHAQQALGDPVLRSYLGQSIERVNRSSAKAMSKSEFLAHTQSD